MIEAIFTIVILIGVGVAAILGTIFINEALEGRERDRNRELKGELDVAQRANKRYAENNEQLKKENEAFLKSLFGEYQTMNLTVEPLTNKKYIVCTYKYSAPVKWELKGKEMPKQILPIQTYTIVDWKENE